jgi:hypothetical protein
MILRQKNRRASKFQFLTHRWIGCRIGNREQIWLSILIKPMMTRSFRFNASRPHFLFLFYFAVLLCFYGECEPFSPCSCEMLLQNGLGPMGRRQYTSKGRGSGDWNHFFRRWLLAGTSSLLLMGQQS